MEASTQVVVALGRLKNLFLEVPDTRLSLTDAARVVGVERHVCEALLLALEDVRFLERSSDGSYGRRYLNRSAAGGQPMAFA
jgi:hypothetical protein